MSRILVIGTGNKHKVEEIAPLLLESGMPLELKTADSYGPFSPEETGGNLEENALIKARAAMNMSGEWALADDTGLFVDALDGRPGIYAARYAGEGCSFADNIRKLLGEMEGIPHHKRTATFRCAIALCRPGHEPRIFRGECMGWIKESPSGVGGFGYDPVFVVGELSKTFAELTAIEKNKVSHRSIAVNLCRLELDTLLKCSTHSAQTLSPLTPHP